MDKPKHKFQSTKDLLLSHDFVGERQKAAKYISHEYQDYGYRLAVTLNDLEHKALYIKIAKDEKRPVVEQALSYTLDYPHAKKKAKVFMWKLYDIKKQIKEKNKLAKADNLKLI